MVMTLVPPEDQRLPPLSRKDVVRIPGHPHHTYDFPAPDEYDAETRHQRLWATLWRVFGFAQHDAHENQQFQLPSNVWQTNVLKEHAILCAQTHTQINLDPMNLRKTLTNNTPRFRFFYAQFYLASRIVLLAHLSLTTEQRGWLEPMKKTLLTDIPYQDKGDRDLARQLLIQIPDFAYLNQPAEEAK